METNKEVTSRGARLARVCFVLSLIEIGIFISAFIAGLIQKIDSGNGVLSLFGDIILLFYLYFPIAALINFFGGLFSFIQLLIDKERNKKLYFYALFALIIGMIAIGFIVFVLIPNISFNFPAPG